MDEQFSSTALADTVLRSSDGVHFYVLGAFLRYVSPIFRDMFLLNTGSAVEQNEMKGGYPVVSLPEDSKTTLCLLRIVHPYIDKPKLDDVKLLIKVWKMAAKYGMDTIVGKLEKHLRGDRWMKEQPQRVFSISTIVDWEGGRVMAGQTLASWSWIPYCKEFEMISGVDYYRLLEYRFHSNGVSQPGDSNTEPEEPTEVSSPHHHLAQADPLVDPGPTRHIRDAEEPFHPHEKADIILRTSDAVDFYVSHLFLQLVSPIFNNMLSDVKGELKDGLMVVGVADHSRAFRPLLLMIYHRMDEPSTENLELFGDLCMAVRKYGLTVMEARLRRQLAASSEQPLRVYAIATSLGWKDVAKSAAKNILNLPLHDAVTCVPELMHITGGDLHRLVNYRMMCVDAACKVVENRASRRGYLTPIPVRHANTRPGRTNTQTITLGVDDIEKNLEESPRGSTYANMFLPLFKKLREKHSFDCWSINEAINMIEDQKNVAGEIEEAIEKVSLTDAKTDEWM